MFVRACYYAAVKHANQRRKDKEQTPYINHPLHAAHILHLAGVTDEEVLVAAVCHDLVEDCSVTYDDLEREFSSRVSEMVRECSDDKSLDKVERKKLQIEHAKKISHGAKLIKLADKLSNISDLDSNPPPAWSKAEIKGYILWAHTVCEQMKGTNDIVETQLNVIFKRHGLHIMDKQERMDRLEDYYKCIDNSE